MALTLGAFHFFTPANLLNSAPVPFVIEEGETIRKVAHRLDEQGVIRSATALRLAAKFLPKEKTIQPGRFILDPHTSPGTILSQLTENQTIKLTIPEGFSTFDIDERLVELKLISAGKFSKFAKLYEGFLFPDTYFISRTNFKTSDLISTMKNTFDKKTKELFSTPLPYTKQDIVILASILEKEVQTQDDGLIVSGILWKRLANDWPLQADATLLYGEKNRTITTEKLEDQNNPYNTNKNKGLPPTPIGNPGIATLRAAAYPKESPYWFYLTGSDGKTHYAVTNEEHNENRKRYLSN